MNQEGEEKNCPYVSTVSLCEYDVALEVCYHQVTHQCQSKTLSSPDFESTYTNKAPLRALAVC